MEAKAFVVKPNSQGEIKFLSDLFKKLGLSSKLLKLEEIEDLGMASLMKDVDRSKKVSRAEIFKKLRS